MGASKLTVGGYIETQRTQLSFGVTIYEAWQGYCYPGRG